MNLNFFSIRQVKMANISQHCKYLHLVYTSNLSGPLFHTSRNPILPNMARGENYNEPDYLYCLRPAKLPVADSTNSNLASEPKSSNQIEGIKPEVFEKWNQRPKQDINKEWNKLTVFY